MMPISYIVSNIGKTEKALLSIELFLLSMYN